MQSKSIPLATRPAAAFAALLLSCSALASPPRRRVIIDQDAFGGTNLQSILMVVQAADVEVVGVTIESGDGWQKENAAHALRMLELVGRTDIPVAPGATYPLLNSEEETRRWEGLHGRLPYKGAWMENWPDYNTANRAHYHAADVVPPLDEGSPTTRPLAEPAAAFLARKVREAPGEISILALGPFTNIALAARLDEGFAANAKELVLMACSFDPDASARDEFSLQFVNSPRVEFNCRWDPEAARITLHSRWRKITVVPTDATVGTMMTAALAREAGGADTPASRYFARYGAPGFPLWDETAAAVWLDPSIIRRSDRLAVDVDIDHGAGYGATLSWLPGFGPGLGEPVVTVVRAIDIPRLERMFADAMRRPTPAP